MSTNPGFVWPGENDDSVLAVAVVDTVDDQGELDVHPSSHSYQGDAPSPLRSTCLTPPPAAQQTNFNDAPESASGSTADESGASDDLSPSVLRSLWRPRYADPVVLADYLPEYEDPEEPSFSQLVQDAEFSELELGEDSHGQQQPPLELLDDEDWAVSSAIGRNKILKGVDWTSSSVAVATTVLATSDAVAGDVDEPRGKQQARSLSRKCSRPALPDPDTTMSPPLNQAEMSLPARNPSDAQSRRSRTVWGGQNRDRQLASDEYWNWLKVV